MPSSLPLTHPSAPLVETVYARLRKAIVTGEYGPNTRLVEVELAESLDVSRTPVRDVLQRLHNEGLVISRRRGWAVRSYTSSEIRQIYEVRMALEGYTARLAAERATAAQRHELRKLAEAFGVAVAAANVGRYAVANDAFHAFLNRLSGNPKLEESIAQAREHYFNYRLAKAFGERQLQASHEDHELIATAIAHGNGVAAEAAVRAHLSQTMRIALTNEGA